MTETSRPPNAAVNDARPPLRYEPALDGLRAFAVIGVVVYHGFPDLLPGGWAGVDLFFVLSGYLITRLLCDEMTARGGIDIGRFYIRRCFRLMPPFYLLLLASSLIGFWQGIAGWPTAVAISGTYLMNVARSLAMGPTYLLGHTWSLATEEQFYLLWPLALLSLLKAGKKPMPWLLAAIGAILLWRCFLVAVGAGFWRTYNGFDTHADGLLIGCAIGLVSIPAGLSVLAARLSVIPVAASAAIFLMLREEWAFTQSIGLTLTALISSWLLISALSRGWLKQICSARPLVFVGKMSYGIYLWHYPLIMLTGEAYGDAGIIGSMIGSVGLAVLSFYTVEQASRRLRDRVERRRAANRGSEARLTRTDLEVTAPLLVEEFWNGNSRD